MWTVCAWWYLRWIQVLLDTIDHAHLVSGPFLHAWRFFETAFLGIFWSLVTPFQAALMSPRLDWLFSPGAAAFLRPFRNRDFACLSSCRCPLFNRLRVEVVKMEPLLSCGCFAVSIAVLHWRECGHVFDLAQFFIFYNVFLSGFFVVTFPAPPKNNWPDFVIPLNTTYMAELSWPEYVS